MACCKLGEEVFSTFLNLYDIYDHDYDLKLLLLEFFFIQIRIHHPNGASEGEPSSYAFSWTNWRNKLRSLYSVLCDEIKSNLNKVKPPLFYGLHNGEKKLHSTLLSLIVEVFRQVSLP